MPVEETAAYDPPPPGTSEPAISVSDNIALFDMANLTKTDTGIDETVTISTAQARHAARVKWYPGRPGRTAPCLSVTVEAQPRALNHNLPAPLAESAAGR